MATVLEGILPKNIVLLCFFMGKRTECKNILKEIFLLLGGKCLLRKAVHNCVEKFSQGRSKVADDTRPSSPVEIATEATVQRVEELIRADRRIRIDSVATALGCLHGLAYCILHDHFKLRKACAQWVPRYLKDREEINQMDLSLQHLLRYADEGEDTRTLNRTVTLGTYHACITTNSNKSVLQ
jgi:hypothetical protein